jgi:peptidoglycan/xylan/chitin deacetylase (PgdA/CDA1 family)
LKRTLGRVLRGNGTIESRKIVLLYHSVGDGPWAVSQKDFAAQMEWLQGAAKITSLAQLLGASAGAPIEVAITFDDGYASVRDAALPVLRGVGAVAAVFLNTGCIADGATRKPSDEGLGHYPRELFLSSDDVGALSAEGWTLGSHGVRHLDLTRTEETTTRAELSLSKSAVEGFTGAPCAYFSYTWGKYTSPLQRLVAQSGYRYAFAGRHAALTARVDPLAVPRINISKEYGLADFQAITYGDWDYLGLVQRLRGA